MGDSRGQVEEALVQLAEAQARTEAALQELTRRCETLVCDIEEIAYIGLRKHPVATKRRLRALMKAANVCTSESERVARFLVDNGYAQHYDYTLQAVRDAPYSKWHDNDPEDTVRFCALRLHQAGMIKSSPQKIIAQGTDWRFLNELKKELKG